MCGATTNNPRCRRAAIAAGRNLIAVLLCLTTAPARTHSDGDVRVARASQRTGRGQAEWASVSCTYRWRRCTGILQTTQVVAGLHTDGAFAVSLKAWAAEQVRSPAALHATGSFAALLKDRWASPGCEQTTDLCGDLRQVLVLRGGGRRDEDDDSAPDDMLDSSLVDGTRASGPGSSSSVADIDRQVFHYTQVQQVRAVYRDGEDGLGSGQGMERGTDDSSSEAREAAAVQPARLAAPKLRKGSGDHGGGPRASNDAPAVFKGRYRDAPDEETAFCMMVDDFGEYTPHPSRLPSALPVAVALSCCAQ